MFASRITDMHVCPLVSGFVPHVGGPIIGPPSGNPVIIGGMLAATIGMQCVCVGPPDTTLLGRGSKVLVNNRPIVCMGDPTAHGGRIIIGCPTVIVG